MYRKEAVSVVNGSYFSCRMKLDANQTVVSWE